jgi:hypothetical protein
MSDNDNVTFFDFKSAKGAPQVTDTYEETMNIFQRGVEDRDAYIQAEETAKGIMHGIIRVCNERIGEEVDDNFFSDAAVISTLIFGMLIRQSRLMSPEVSLLDDLAASLTAVKGEPK